MVTKEDIKIELDRISKELAKLVGYLESEIDFEKEKALALRSSLKVIKVVDKKPTLNKK